MGQRSNVQLALGPNTTTGTGGPLPPGAVPAVDIVTGYRQDKIESSRGVEGKKKFGVRRVFEGKRRRHYIRLRENRPSRIRLLSSLARWEAAPRTLGTARQDGSRPPWQHAFGGVPRHRAPDSYVIVGLTLHCAATRQDYVDAFWSLLAWLSSLMCSLVRPDYGRPSWRQMIGSLPSHSHSLKLPHQANCPSPL